MKLVLRAQKTTKGYIRAENKLQPVSQLVISQVIISQIFCSQIMTQMLSKISEHKPTKTITCFGADLYSAGTQHGNLHQLSVTMSRLTFFILFCGPTQEPVLVTDNTVKTRERFGKKNAGEWTRRVEISKEEIPGSRCSTRGYIRTCSRLKRENLGALGSQQMGL